MATPDDRKALADKWFSMGHVASAFAQIRDSEFETVKLSSFCSFYCLHFIFDELLRE